MKQAVIYARVSDRRQAAEELPIESQLERCRQRADELSARVDRVFVDEGISGAQDQRPAFQDAIAYAELTQPDYFITWSTSRFSRSAHDAALYKRRLSHAGVDLIYISLPVDRSTDSGWVLESVLEIFDELTIRQISADTKRSMLRLAEKGHWTGGHPPYGFQPIPDPDDPRRKRLEPKPDEADTVREMIDLRLTGHGAKAIADYLNGQGITNRGKRWYQGTVLYTLKSEALIGRIVFNRKDRATGRRRPEDQWIRVQAHPPIVDRDKWEAVQKMIQRDSPGKGSGSPHSTHLFTGLIRCTCGSRLQIKTATGGSGKLYRYYECQQSRRGSACPGRRIPARELDEWLLDIVSRRVFSRENLEEVYASLIASAGQWRKDQAKRLRRAHNRRRKLEQSQSNLFGILELHGRNAPDLSDLTARLRSNKEKLLAVEQQIEEIESEDEPPIIITPDDLSPLQEFLIGAMRDTRDAKRTRAFLADIVERIDVLEDEIQIKYHPDRLVGADTVRSTETWLPGSRLLRTAIEALPVRWRRAA